MSPSQADTSAAINILVADSNRMQAQLLTSALRRHSEFNVATCPMDSASILKAVATKLPRVALLSLNQPENATETVMTLRGFHLSHREIPKILMVDSCDREVVIS